MTGSQTSRPPSSFDRCQRGREPVIRDDGAIEIPLTRGDVALVDLAGYELVRERLWISAFNPKFGESYATSHSPGATGPLYMHRVVAGATDRRQYVDHENHDTLDNRSGNLRIVRSRENQQNRRPSSGCSSRFKGVHWHKGAGKWMGQMMVDRKHVYLGLFVDEEEAARAYDSEALKRFGPVAITNASAGLL